MSGIEIITDGITKEEWEEFKRLEGIVTSDSEIFILAKRMFDWRQSTGQPGNDVEDTEKAFAMAVNLEAAWRKQILAKYHEKIGH